MAEQPFRVAGRRRARMDGIGKVTGKSPYVADLALPGMLFGKLFRSSVPHARIRRLDTSRARAIPGVRGVLTAADIASVRYGPAVKDMHALAVDRVRYIGEPIVAVAATTPEIAQEALAAIDVAYEPLPALFAVEQSLAAGAPLLHPDWSSYQALPMLIRDGNVAAIARLRGGDVEAGFAEAFRVYEHRFTTQIVHAGYTEPRVAVANWEASDRLVVWSSAQLPFDIQNVLAEILAVPSSAVRVIVPGIGGGFGGKLRIGVEHYAALLARATGRPVKVMSTGEEELTASHPRQPAIITIKSGVTRDGRILAKQGRVVVDTGAFAGSGPGVAAVATQILAGPYVVPNILLEGLAVYTNKVPTGSFRAPSGPMANFAVESQLDIIADDLGIDPLELRLRNVMREGDRGPAGEVVNAVSVEECLLKAAQAIDWHDRRPAPHRGKGIACSWWMTTGGSSGVNVRIDPQGTATLVSGAVELGTGALTGAAQILAEELALDLDDIKIGPVDTQASPYDYGAQGSRTTFSVGNACRAAAADLRNQILQLAAKHLEVPPDQLELRDKAAIAGNKSVTIAEIARLAQLSGGGLIAHGTAISPPPSYDRSRVEGHPLPVWNTPSFHAHAADVSVDPETGEISINRYVVVQDVGFAINPTYIEGQIQGGVAQGLGQALSEEIVIEDGRVLNANLTDYKMPTALDVPPVECILVECASQAGPYGAKGVGEPPCIEPPAAIANAVSAAVGLRVYSLPITAEKIALGLRDSRSI